MLGIGLFTGYQVGQSGAHEAAIKEGHAYYKFDQKTGKTTFIWGDQK